MTKHWLRALAALLIAVGFAGAAASSAWADAEGNIDHAETKDGTVRVLYSIPDLPDGVEPDLSTLKVTLNGTAVDAVAKLASSAGQEQQVRRTAILAIDTSRSMKGDRFTQAKAAAKAFLDAAPKDLNVGIVTFDGKVQVLQKPTLDRAAASTAIDNLALSFGTVLYDGVITAAETAGKVGQRSLLVLSDGEDASNTKLQEAVSTIAASKVRVDVVSMGDEKPEAAAALDAMASAGGGSVVAAHEPGALTELFNKEAAALARQLLVTAKLPQDFKATEGSVAVSIEAGGQTYSNSAYVSYGKAPTTPATTQAGPQPVSAPPLAVGNQALLGGIAALGVGVLMVLLFAFGVVGKRDKASLDDHISAYTRAGAAMTAKAAAARQAVAGGTSSTVAQSAVDLAQKALASNTGFEAKLGAKLEGADIKLKPAEWILVHVSVVLGAGALGLMLSSGGIALAVLFGFLGAVVPWLFLSIKKGRRLKAFNGQLAETLQLISGSLSAGLSLAQALDTVVREGSDPIAGEFRRALVEARLGVNVEDALDSIAKRMESADFEWIVMAIRIQREVGGNLAELLLQVAATMRERDYLRRQVKTLSAEGKLSAWILGALPPGIFVYMMMVNPDYLHPLITTSLGWMMLGVAVVMMGIGAFWMSRVVKVEV
jgi:tight adherence protein B